MLLLVIFLIAVPYLAFAFAVGRMLGRADDLREAEYLEAGMAIEEEMPEASSEPVLEPRAVPIRNGGRTFG